MPKKPSKLDIRNRLIAEEYVHLFFIEGKRDKIIYETLADKYFLEPDTVRKIVLRECKQSTPLQAVS